MEIKVVFASGTEMIEQTTPTSSLLGFLQDEIAVRYTRRSEIEENSKSMTIPT